jgi:hypothetical protein
MMRLLICFRAYILDLISLYKKRNKHDLPYLNDFCDGSAIINDQIKDFKIFHKQKLLNKYIRANYLQETPPSCIFQ